ncbi:MAG: winged helix-turn-helix transcriptional regulator [Candidatus Thermoplasmatota archaeon]|nr:winged helix-turn-helix transcriptional regulator [Candidatus Thermoplasmatota archaeon]
MKSLHVLDIPKEMDDIDRKILIAVSANPRIQLRELAKRLGISRQAIYYRIQVLMRIGVIKGTMAGVSLPYLDAVPVAIFGVSKTASIDKTLDRLGESEFSRRADFAGGNFLYVVGFLREISELEGYVEFVKRVGEIPDPTIGIYSLDLGLMPDYSVNGGGRPKPQSYRDLSPLDLRIVVALKDDARRSTSEVAKMVGVSVKTVSRHLERMISEGSLEMSTPQDLSSAGDLFAVMHVTLREGADKAEVGSRLLSKHMFVDEYVRTFTNIPNLLIWVFWSDKMTEIRRAVREADEDEDVRAVMLNLVYLERIYTTTWRDRLPAVRTPPPGKARTRSLHPAPRT